MNSTVLRTGIAVMAAVALAASTASCSSTSDNKTPAASNGATTQGAQTKQLTFGYISPGPDTWYKRDAEGFAAAAAKYGVKVVELNSQYDQQKELANIQNLVGQGVDGISMFSFNENGAVSAAQAGQKAGIPVVLTDDVGSAISKGAKLAAAVDFDWCAMGEKYATTMAERWPGQNYAMLAGNFEAPPTKILDDCMMKKAAALGKNKNVFLQQTGYDPAKAVTLTESLLASGTDFGVLFVMNDDMGAAVAQTLKSKGVAGKIHMMTENGSDVGIPMLKAKTLDFTISNSPGWEGSVAFLALYAAATGKIPAGDNKQIKLPVVAIDQASDLTDKTVVVPWQVDEAFWTLNGKYFPDLVPSKS